MSTQQTKSLYVSKLLTDVSTAYNNENYISEKVFPIVQVKKDTAKIAVYDMANLRIEDSERAPGSKANEVDHKVSISDHYTLVEHALQEIVPDEHKEQADKPIRPMIDATENITDKLWVEKEKELADFITSGTNITKNTTLSGTDQWSDYANSDPIGDVSTGRESVRTYSGKKANSLIMAHDVFIKLVDHPDVTDRLKYSRTADFKSLASALGPIFDLQNILVGDAQYNSAKQGSTDVLADIWSKDVVIAYVDPRPNLKSRSLGFTYQMKAPRAVDTWREIERKGDWVRVTDKYDQKLVDNTCGYLIIAAVA